VEFGVWYEFLFQRCCRVMFFEFVSAWDVEFKGVAWYCLYICGRVLYVTCDDGDEFCGGSMARVRWLAQ